MLDAIQDVSGGLINRKTYATLLLSVLSHGSMHALLMWSRAWIWPSALLSEPG